jgi:predicted metal-binding protein
VSARVFICLTCNRYAPPPAEELTPGQCLATAVKSAAAKAASQVTVRTVVCLNGCPHPCAAALRDPGKSVIRFAELTTDDATALLEAAELYAQSTDGELAPESLPPTLRAKVSARAAPRVV